DVRERLREVPEGLAAVRIDLLSVQAEIVREADQLLEGVPGRPLLAERDEREDAPEAADPEGTLRPGKAVVAEIAEDEGAPREPCLDGPDRRREARPIRRVHEPLLGREQEAGVGIRGPDRGDQLRPRGS